MANSRTSANRYEEASVDTDPGSAGYGCNPVSPRAKSKAIGEQGKKVCFYISSIASGATVTVRWKRRGAVSYTEYGDYTAVTREQLSDDSVDILYDAIVKDDAQGTGTTVFGFDW